MGRTTLLVTLFLLTAALPLFAQSQQESLGDVARQLREQRSKDAKKATKVFTNDNLPAPAPMEAVNSQVSQPAAPEGSAAPAETASKPASPPSTPETKSPETKSDEPKSPEDKAKTRDYWQEKFKAARQAVAKAKEMQQLAEDELNLLQIQQVREMDPAAKADLTAKVQTKQSEVEANQAATDKAQKALDDLEKEFQSSGAPGDWSQTD